MNFLSFFKKPKPVPAATPAAGPVAPRIDARHYIVKNFEALNTKIDDANKLSALQFGALSHQLEHLCILMERQNKTSEVAVKSASTSPLPFRPFSEGIDERRRQIDNPGEWITAGAYLKAIGREKNKSDSHKLSIRASRLMKVIGVEVISRTFPTSSSGVKMTNSYKVYPLFVLVDAFKEVFSEE